MTPPPAADPLSGDPLAERLHRLEIDCPPELARQAVATAMSGERRRHPWSPAPRWNRRGGTSAASYVRWGWRGVLVAAAVMVVGSVGTWTGNRRTPPPTTADGVTVSVSLAGTSLSCSIAIRALSNDRTAGLITLRNGRATFTPAPTEGRTYVSGLGRWVTGSPELVAPSEESYAYEERGDREWIVHIVDAHQDRRIAVAPGVSARAWTAQGILLERHANQGHGFDSDFTPAMEILDPVSGTIRSLGTRLPDQRSLRAAPTSFAGPRISGTGGGTGTSYTRSGNSFWTVAFDHNGSTVQRFDPMTGGTTLFYNGPGYAVVVGADGRGAPIIQISDQDLFHSDPEHRSGIRVRTLLFPAPNVMTVLNQGSVGDPGVIGSLSPVSVTDGDAVWAASDDGALYLYRPAAGLRQVARVTTSTKGSPGVVVTSPCRR